MEEKRKYILYPGEGASWAQIAAHEYEVVLTPNTYPYVQFWTSGTKEAGPPSEVFGLAKGWWLRENGDSESASLEDRLSVLLTWANGMQLPYIALVLDMPESLVEAVLRTPVPDSKFVSDDGAGKRWRLVVD